MLHIHHKTQEGTNSCLNEVNLMATRRVRNQSQDFWCGSLKAQLGFLHHLKLTG